MSRGRVVAASNAAALSAAPAADASASSGAEAAQGSSVSGLSPELQAAMNSKEMQAAPFARRKVIPFAEPSAGMSEAEKAVHREMMERHYLFWVENLFYAYLGGSAQDWNEEDKESEAGKQYQEKLKQVAVKIFNECKCALTKSEVLHSELYSHTSVYFCLFSLRR